MWYKESVNVSFGRRFYFNAAATTGINTLSLHEALPIFWLTAPYLHDGRAMTLRDVLVAFNNNDKHGTTAHLSDEELFALEAFLLALPLTPKEFSELRGK